MAAYRNPAAMSDRWTCCYYESAPRGPFYSSFSVECCCRAELASDSATRPPPPHMQEPVARAAALTSSVGQPFPPRPWETPASTTSTWLGNSHQRCMDLNRRFCGVRSTPWKIQQAGSVKKQLILCVIRLESREPARQPGAPCDQLQSAAQAGYRLCGRVCAAAARVSRCLLKTPEEPPMSLIFR
jgi:hypothetical protein